MTVSESTKRDLITHLKLSDEKIHVIAPVIGNEFMPLERHAVLEFAKRYELDTNCRWLMVSGREFYKNHSASLQVFKRLLLNTDLDIRLIKTGLSSADFDKKVIELGLENNVKSVYLDDISDMPYLYNFVDCLLFPSLYEGFGMPVAEALACGTPVVVSDRASLPEVGGDLSLTNAADDILGLSESVLRILKDKEIKQELTHRGPEWCERFRAPAIAASHRTLYSKMVG